VIQDVETSFERFSAHAYDHLRVLDSLLLIGGLSYDRVSYPVNFRYAPLSDAQDTTDAFSPKAGVIWTPWRNTTVRAAYTRSLGGVSFDQSFRLEPAQVAGFTQAYRSLIPESVAGANAVPKFETCGVSVDQRLPTHTYLGVTGEILESQVNRDFGIFTFQFPPQAATPSETPERLDYRERSLTLSAVQLLGNCWSLRARYRLSDAELDDQFTQIPSDVFSPSGVRPKQDLEALLHQVDLFAVFNHPSGLFGELGGTWYSQTNDGYEPDLAGDAFWQVNLFAGYCFFHRRAELKLGVLNLTDQDYRLNPLNWMNELPRARTLLMSAKFSF
jgi:outer membrane receptor protein involved in Fe transport